MSGKNFRPFDLAAAIMDHGELFVEPGMVAGQFGVRLGFREKKGATAITRALAISMTHEQAREFIEQITASIKESENYGR